MTVDRQEYEDHLEYFPEKERKALEEALFLDDDRVDAVKSTIRQINRSKRAEQKPEKSPQKQLLTVLND